MAEQEKGGSAFPREFLFMALVIAAGLAALLLKLLGVF